MERGFQAGGGYSFSTNNNNSIGNPPPEAFPQSPHHNNEAVMAEQLKAQQSEIEQLRGRLASLQHSSAPPPRSQPSSPPRAVSPTKLSYPSRNSGPQASQHKPITRTAPLTASEIAANLSMGTMRSMFAPRYVDEPAAGTAPQNPRASPPPPAPPRRPIDSPIASAQVEETSHSAYVMASSPISLREMEARPFIPAIGEVIPLASDPADLQLACQLEDRPPDRFDTSVSVGPVDMSKFPPVGVPPQGELGSIEPPSWHKCVNEGLPDALVQDQRSTESRLRWLDSMWETVMGPKMAPLPRPVGMSPFDAASLAVAAGLRQQTGPPINPGLTA